MAKESEDLVMAHLSGLFKLRALRLVPQARLFKAWLVLSGTTLQEWCAARGQNQGFMSRVLGGSKRMPPETAAAIEAEGGPLADRW